ncbi:hypothetical protein L8S13_24680 [Vibrio lentus]|uniref:hypothetical protein n=1 Tax=Vibrio lentus TaxID=136468 RepID=UPI0024688548|nr:hypothetical protein [Vibrio lentus]MDH5929483.1 hypothetical protein [Vibrio lentus]
MAILKITSVTCIVPTDWKNERDAELSHGFEIAEAYGGYKLAKNEYIASRGANIAAREAAAAAVGPWSVFLFAALMAEEGIAKLPRGADDLYIVVETDSKSLTSNDKKKIFPKNDKYISIDANDTLQINRWMAFTGKKVIRLMEWDRLSGDDYIGFVYINSEEPGFIANETITSSSESSLYQLSYSVIWGDWQFSKQKTSTQKAKSVHLGPSYFSESRKMDSVKFEISDNNLSLNFYNQSTLLMSTNNLQNKPVGMPTYISTSWLRVPPFKVVVGIEFIITSYEKGFTFKDCLLPVLHCAMPDGTLPEMIYSESKEDIIKIGNADFDLSSIKSSYPKHIIGLAFQKLDYPDSKFTNTIGIACLFSQ